MMCDIWRIRQVREITRDDLESPIQSLLDFRFAGSCFRRRAAASDDFVDLCRVLRSNSIRSPCLLPAFYFTLTPVQ